MRWCKTPLHCFAKPLCVSCSMMFMLPIRGRPFDLGGYDTIFLQIRDAMQSNNSVNRIVNKRVSRNDKTTTVLCGSKRHGEAAFLIFKSQPQGELDGKACAAIGQSSLMALYNTMFSQVGTKLIKLHIHYHHNFQGILASKNNLQTR
ncbi:hypothetical protein D0Y65_038370 [Glycine soja]|uniref:Uncharacterized protein n=1 Tax=Glycine soja TaxID=3848 RepID=A0A445H4M0_GLYSO|nr:hypothetical protein D0Y65_038370 [Glycine soja]